MTVVCDQERHRRVVEEDSKRKRDLAGYRRVVAAQEREHLEALTRATDAEWMGTLDRLRASVPESTFRLWLEPLQVAGGEGATLFVTAPEDIRTWAERRYAGLIGEALQATSDFTSVRFVTAGGAE